MTTATRGPGRLDAAALRELLKGDTPPRILDVRTPAEFETAHIPGSYNVPLDTLREHRDELARHLDEDVVLVCRSGGRATQAGKAFSEVGLPNLKVLEGGTAAWEQAGGPMARGRQRWELERQVRLVAGSVVLASVLGSVAVPQLKWVAAFIGAGLTFAALSNTCAMAAVLSKLPYNRGAGCDINAVKAQLAAAPNGERR